MDRSRLIVRRQVERPKSRDGSISSALSMSRKPAYQIDSGSEVATCYTSRFGHGFESATRFWFCQPNFNEFFRQRPFRPLDVVFVDLLGNVLLRRPCKALSPNDFDI